MCICTYKCIYVVYVHVCIHMCSVDLVMHVNMNPLYASLSWFMHTHVHTHERILRTHQSPYFNTQNERKMSNCFKVVETVENTRWRICDSLSFLQVVVFIILDTCIYHVDVITPAFITWM